MNLFFLFFVLGTAIAAPPKSDLVRLIELAEKNSPVIQRSRLALEQSQLELRTARAAFLPTLNLESEHGWVDKNPPPDDRLSTIKSKVALTAKENLYDNGKSITNYKLANRRLERARIEYELARDEQLLKIANTFYDWSSATQARRIADLKQKVLLRQFHAMETYYKQGLKTKRDVLRIETEVRKIEIDLLRSDNELEMLKRRLASQIGVSLAELNKIGAEVEEAKLNSPIDSGPWSELTTEEHRRAKIFKYQHKEAELETRLVEREYWPQLLLEGEVANVHENYVDTGRRFANTEVWTGSVLLKLNYNLWDFGTRHRNLQISRIKEKTIQSQSHEALLNLGNELREVFLKLKELSETLKLTKELLNIEEQSYNVLEAEHRSGRATYLDMITNLNSLFEARSRFASSYFGLKKQQLLYAFHKGNLYEVLRQK